MADEIENGTPQVAYSLFTESGKDGLAQIRSASSMPGAHENVDVTARALEVRPVGSGENGPSSGDFAQTISLIKKDWLTTQVPGEIDGLYIVVRQSGPDAGPAPDTARSDASAILANVQNYGPTGFVAVIDASVSNATRNTYAINARLQAQMGVINTDGGGQQGYGFVASAHVGTLLDGIRIQQTNSAAGSWTYFYSGVKDGVRTFSVTPEGVVTGTSAVDAVGRLQAVPRSTTAALAAIGNAINTTNKFAGKLVINTTTGAFVTAIDATAGGVWQALNGTTAHTPI